MTLRTEFSLINSEFNGFLHAPIGEEESGTQLTVLSALSRLALDPWGEADRLSGLPKEKAVTAMAAMIARLPRGRWEASDVRAIAARLVQLLPERAHAPPPNRVVGAAGERKNVTAVLWLVILLLFAGLFGMQSLRTDGAPDPVPGTSWSQQEQNRP
jgi:hypothetical protein